VPSAADWNELHADPLTADVVTAETTTATTYGDLTTAGPAVTKTLVNGQKVLVIVSARMDNSAANESDMSFAVSGSTTLAASDDNAASIIGTSDGVHTRMTVFTAGASGSHTFTAKYRVTPAGTGTFRRRRIIVKPF